MAWRVSSLHVVSRQQHADEGGQKPRLAAGVAAGSRRADAEVPECQRVQRAVNTSGLVIQQARAAPVGLFCSLVPSSCCLTNLCLSPRSSLRRESHPAQPSSPAQPDRYLALTLPSPAIARDPRHTTSPASSAATRATATSNAIAALPARSSLRHPTALLPIVCAPPGLPRRESLGPVRDGTRSPTLDAPLP
jgi:hypothetical protein